MVHVELGPDPPGPVPVVMFACTQEPDGMPVPVMNPLLSNVPVAPNRPEPTAVTEQVEPVPPDPLERRNGVSR